MLNSWRKKQSSLVQFFNIFSCFYFSISFLLSFYAIIIGIVLPENCKPCEHECNHLSMCLCHVLAEWGNKKYALIAIRLHYHQQRCHPESKCNLSSFLHISCDFNIQIAALPGILLMECCAFTLNNQLVFSLQS